MKFWTKTVIAMLPALVLLGCGTSGEVQDEAAGGAGQATQGTSESSSVSTSGVNEGEGVSGEAMGETGATTMGAATASGFQGDPLDDPNSLLANRVIYFDFDKSDIKSEFTDTVRAHAEYLANNPDVNITLEGHCDERGTREYNIALGERRANAVKRMLTLQGVSASQIRTVSYGEERPRPRS
jgi:peptidoglycan-associated lipoprotein